MAAAAAQAVGGTCRQGREACGSQREAVGARQRRASGSIAHVAWSTQAYAFSSGGIFIIFAVTALREQPATAVAAGAQQRPPSSQAAAAAAAAATPFSTRFARAAMSDWHCPQCGNLNWCAFAAIVCARAFFFHRGKFSQCLHAFCHQGAPTSVQSMPNAKGTVCYAHG